MIPTAQAVAVDILSEQMNFLVALFAEGPRFVDDAICGSASLAPAREWDDTE
jgi:hypothetical protein